MGRWCYNPGGRWEDEDFHSCPKYSEGFQGGAVSLRIMFWNTLRGQQRCHLPLGHRDMWFQLLSNLPFLAGLASLFCLVQGSKSVVFRKRIVWFPGPSICERKEPDEKSVIHRDNFAPCLVRLRLGGSQPEGKAVNRELRGRYLSSTFTLSPVNTEENCARDLLVG